MTLPESFSRGLPCSRLEDPENIANAMKLMGRLVVTWLVISCVLHSRNSLVRGDEPECLRSDGSDEKQPECLNLPVRDSAEAEQVVAPTEAKATGIEATIPQWPGKTCDMKPMSLLDDLDRYPSISGADIQRSERLYGEHGRRYIIRSNRLYGRDGSQHAIVGVASFVEAMLTQLLKEVKVPDVDFVLNCADNPSLPNFKVDLDATLDVPVVSMCGSTQYRDIIVPTYTMAMVATKQRSSHYDNLVPWNKRLSKLVWRGTDSNYDRFAFNLLANNKQLRNYTDVGISQMVRIQHDVTQHGPLRPYMPEPDYGKYKWIANIDGAVAAYRMPAVASLGSTIVKQQSHFLEHWYRQFQPWIHYVPMNSDFSDLSTVLDWLQTHDDEAQRIGEAGRQFVLDHLQPDSILCFWYVFLHEYAARLTYQPVVLDGMTPVGLNSN